MQDMRKGRRRTAAVMRDCRQSRRCPYLYVPVPPTQCHNSLNSFTSSFCLLVLQFPVLVFDFNFCFASTTPSQ